jgi:16S rRNA (guanine966-N2)-methyltransferase
MLMRITGGELKGRKIKTPAASFSRPLLSRVRKSLFDVLGKSIEGSSFLDLYAGSGAVGIEALSRGAREAVLVEKDPRCVSLIKENLSSVGLFSQYRVYPENVLIFLGKLLKKETFDIIFVAPPYYKGMQNGTLDVIEKEEIHGCTVIVQHCPREQVNFSRKNLNLEKQREYGDTILTFLEA